MQWLKQAGTSPDYPGLYRDVREFQPPTSASLAAVKQLPEAAQISSLVETMVAMDELLERLKGAQKTGWKSVPGHPDIQPAHEATLLWEQFRELVRGSEREKRPADYLTRLVDAEKSADRFRSLLRQSPVDSTGAESVFKQVIRSCSACHQQHRN